MDPQELAKAEIEAMASAITDAVIAMKDMDEVAAAAHKAAAQVRKEAGVKLVWFGEASTTLPAGELQND